MPTPHTAEWYATVQEETLEPERPIVDPHHHLWEDASRWGRYVREIPARCLHATVGFDPLPIDGDPRPELPAEVLWRWAVPRTAVGAGRRHAGGRRRPTGGQDTDLAAHGLSPGHAVSLRRP